MAEGLARGGLLGILLVMFFVSAYSGTAGAQTEEAEAMIRQGVELRQVNRDAAALPFFEKAYRLSRNARTAAQLGLVQLALGYWVDAERYLNEALGIPDHPWIAGNLAALEQARTAVREMIGEVTITGGPIGAEVFVNRQSVGRLPLASAVRLGKGSADIELRAPGYVSAFRSHTVSGATQDRISITLVQETPIANPTVGALESPRSVALASHGLSPQVRTAGQIPEPMASNHDTQPKASPSSGAMRPLAWVAGAGAAAGIAFGIVETVVAANKRDMFNNHTMSSPTPEEPDRRVLDCTTFHLSAECKTLSDAHDHAKSMAVVGYVVGGTLAATSAVLFILSASGGRGEPRDSPSVALACAPDLTAPGFSCRLTF